MLLKTYILITLIGLVKGRRGLLSAFFPASEVSAHFPNVTGNPLFLTPLIKANRTNEGRKLSRARIPKQEDIEGFSGFLTVNDPACQSNLFFWFFPAIHNPKNAPVVLWLQGGPGGSSLFGLFVEHGPFRITSDMKAEKRSTSWNMNHNVIYFDQPVGTGFSFTKKDSCYVTNEDQVAKDMYEALSQFFTLFPEYRSNDFYVTGESYAGKYVPAIASSIDKNNQDSKNKDKINLKGIAIGDGLCDPVTMTNYGDFLFEIGLIDEEDRHFFKEAEKKVIDYINKKEWDKAFHIFDSLLNGDLSGHPSYFRNATGFNYYFNYLITEPPKEFNYYPKYLNDPRIRRAIHVGNLTYNDGSEVEKHLLNDVMQSVKPLVEELLEKYKVMIYNGQTDIIIAWPLTESFITSMKWSGAKKYLETKRKIWRYGSDIAGYVKEVGNFTQVLVRNSGHMIPYDQPKWAFDLITRFTRGKGFASLFTI